MALSVTLNGQSRTFDSLIPDIPLTRVIAELSLKGDRIAVEHNGEIAPRARWENIHVRSGDRLEIVHFVGGGCLGKLFANAASGEYR
jgi:sulfur carrier protein